MNAIFGMFTHFIYENNDKLYEFDLNYNQRSKTGKNWQKKGTKM